ncbi:MAG TPA: hypothetical protein VMR00_01190 [Streptosporangiaceae bacterium]|jgi:hypothetical protein|nr:hypothetical protein [Streptosporangiaceae bacterium]
MTDQPADEPELPESFHRDRREHGGAPEHLDDDRLARLTEEERVAAGLDPYDPDEVPPATDTPPDADITESPEYQAERAEIEREVASGELETEDGPAT